jgi:hypothetical protein
MGIGIIVVGIFAAILICIGTATPQIYKSESDIKGSNNETLGTIETSLGIYIQKAEAGSVSADKDIECKDYKDKPTSSCVSDSRSSNCGWLQFSGYVVCILAIGGAVLCCFEAIPFMYPNCGCFCSTKPIEKLQMIGTCNMIVYIVLSVWLFLCWVVMAAIIADDADGCDGKKGTEPNKINGGVTFGLYFFSWILVIVLSVFAYVFKIQDVHNEGGADGAGEKKDNPAHETETPAPQGEQVKA